MRSVAAIDPAALERALGHVFCDRDLLDLALTHCSVSGSRNNERLEFLGDAVLGQVVAAELYQRFPQAAEGQLTRARARLVNADALAGLAKNFALDEYVRLGPGELKSGGFRRSSILADCVEALIGAIFLDAGIAVARARILAWYAPLLADLRVEDVVKDPKTRLQEWLQARGLPLPRYELLETIGKTGEQQFRVSCLVEGAGRPAETELVEAWGDNRRIAEQIAAERVLALLEEGGVRRGI